MGEKEKIERQKIDGLFVQLKATVFLCKLIFFLSKSQNPLLHSFTRSFSPVSHSSKRKRSRRRRKNKKMGKRKENHEKPFFPFTPYLGPKKPPWPD